MPKLLKAFLLFLIFSPLWAYLLSLFEIEISYYDIISIAITIYFIVFLIRKKVTFPRYYYLLLLYLAIIAFPIITNRSGYTQLLNVMATFSILVIINNTYFSDSFLKDMLFWFKITIAVSLAVSVTQFFDPSFFTSKQLLDAEFLQSIYLARRPSIYSYLNPNDIGLSFLPIFAIFVGIELKRNIQAALIWMILGGLICFLSNARYIILGYILIVVLMYYYTEGVNLSKVIKWTFRILLISISIIYVLGVFGYDFQEFYRERLFPEGSLKNTSRYLAWEAFKIFFPRDPWFGTGTHLTTEIEDFLDNQSSQIHIGYLSHLVTYGIVGSIPIFLFWIIFAAQLFRNSKKSRYFGSYIGFLIFIWANFTFVRYSMLSYGLIFAFVFNRYSIQFYREEHILKQPLKIAR